MVLEKVLNPIDRDALRDQVRRAEPFPHFCIDNFLTPEFADEVEAAFPTLEEAMKMGRSFAAVNERGKVQITNSKVFAEPIRRLHEELASPEFLDLMSYALDVPGLMADPELVGGGIHETGPRGHLDVHVDFNYIEERDLHRRANILVYMNKNWKPEWGGNIELWDKDVKKCHHSFSPIFNRCVVFATNEISYHGVTAVKCPEGVMRKSFAAYYYTKEAPAGWTGEKHSTIFKARPNERLKKYLLMPGEKAKRTMQSTVQKLKRTLKGK